MKLQLLAVLLLVASPGFQVASAAGEPKVAESDAERLFLAGRQAYREGRFDLAIDSFQAAFTLSQEPGLLFNIGQAYRKKFVIEPRPDLLRLAVDAYRRYMKLSPDGPNRAAAQQYLEELTPIESRLAPGAAPIPDNPVGAARTQLLVVTETDGALVSLDGGEPQRAPLLADVAPGDHHAVVEAPGHLPRSLKLLAVKDRLISVQASLDPKPGRLAIDGMHGARLFVDGKETSRIPLAIELPPGSHQLFVSARGHKPWTRTVDLVPGQEARLLATPARTKQRRAAQILAVAAGLFGAGTAASGIVWAQGTLQSQQIWNESKNVGNLGEDDYNRFTAATARAGHGQLATWTCLGVGAGLGLLSAALYLFDEPAPPERP